MMSLMVDARADGYIGTYTGGAGAVMGSAGIYHFEWDARRGAMRNVAAAAVAANPSFLVLHPRGNILYAVNEGIEAGVGAYAIQRGGELALLNSVSAQGRGPCHLAIDSTGRWLFVANYGSGNMLMIALAADGSLGEVRQNIQHRDETARHARAHQTVLSPDGHFVLSVDLGLDKVFIYRFDGGTGALTPNHPAAFDAPPGSGPRHLLFSKKGDHVYLLTELSADLLTLDWDATRGTLRQRAAVQVLPPGYIGERSGAEIALHPNGRWLYASSRGTADDIAAFSLGRDGMPQLIAHQPAGGRTPRFIGFAPDGRFLAAANQGSNAISVFRIETSGRLRLRGLAPLPAPVAILWH